MENEAIESYKTVIFIGILTHVSSSGITTAGVVRHPSLYCNLAAFIVTGIFEKVKLSILLSSPEVSIPQVDNK